MYGHSIFVLKYEHKDGRCRGGNLNSVLTGHLDSAGARLT
jgi:hypothetical protein